MSGELLFNVYETLITYNREIYWEFHPLLATNVPSRVDIRISITDTSTVGADPTGSTWTSGLTCVGFNDFNEQSQGFSTGDVIYMTDGTIYRTWFIESLTGIGTNTITLNLWRGSYTFNIRITPTINFYDETGNVVDTFDIEDAAYSFKRGLVQDQVASPMWLFYEPLFAHMSSDEWNTGNPVDTMNLAHMIDNAIEVSGNDLTINVGIPFPDTAFKQILSQTWSSIVSKQFSLSIGCWNGDLYTDSNGNGYPDWWDSGLVRRKARSPYDATGAYRYVGTGPYYVSVFNQAGNTVVLQRNTNSWQGWPYGNNGNAYSTGYVDTYEIDYIADWTARKNAFLAGSIDSCAVPRAYMFELLNRTTKEPLYPYIKTIKNIAPTLTSDSFLFTFIVDPYYNNYIGTGSFPSGIPLDFFNNTHVRKAFACAIGRGNPKYTERDTVSVNDSRLTAVNVTDIRYSNSSTVKSQDEDRGWTLTPFSAWEKYVDGNSNNIYDPGELVYNDTDNNGVVSRNDVRLTNVTLMTGREEVGVGIGSKTVFHLSHTHVMPQSETIWIGGVLTTDYTIDYEAGKLTFNSPPGDGETITAWNYTYYFASTYPEETTVKPGDKDLNLVLRNFVSNTMFYDQNGNGVYDRKEFIYNDVGRNVVSDGDIRNDEVYPGYASGSTVNPNDRDVGRTLNNGQNHYNSLIEDSFYNEAGEPVTPLIEGLYPDYRDATVLSYNYSHTEAENELKAASVGGQNVWTSGFTLTLPFNAGNDQARIACQMISDFFLELSTYGGRVGNPFSVNLQEVDMSTLFNDFVASRIPACVIGWSADFSDADSFIREYMHSAGHLASFQNYSASNGWGNTKDILIDLALATADGLARQTLYQQLQQIYINDCPSFPLYQSYGRRWCQYWVKGWYHDALYPATYIPSVYKYDDCWFDVTGTTVSIQDGIVNMREIAYLIAHYNAQAPVPGKPVGPKWVGTYGNGGVDPSGDRLSNMRDILGAILHFNHKNNTLTP
jgi:ABC-type oligopeptide transport system substrate-binding subunit